MGILEFVNKMVTSATWELWGIRDLIQSQQNESKLRAQKMCYSGSLRNGKELNIQISMENIYKTRFKNPVQN